MSKFSKEINNCKEVVLKKQLQKYKKERRYLLKELSYEGITKRTLSAMNKIPRELFVPQNLINQAYENKPLSIGQKQTISQPYIVGRMIDLLNVKRTDNVLEIGGGSYYLASILSLLCKKITSIERIPELISLAQKRLSLLPFNNLLIILSDGTLGFENNAPYDKIILSAGATEQIPEPLFDQLKVGGVMLLPKKVRGEERLIRIIKEDKNHYIEEMFERVRFVPLIGKYGYK